MAIDDHRRKHYAAPILKAPKRGSRKEVMYPVSQDYNGGLVLGGEWYKGVVVPPPIVPDGWELVDICVGLQLNAVPPLATKILRKIDPMKEIENSLKAVLRIFVEGRNYDTQNPYTRPEIKRAMKALAQKQGITEYYDADLTEKP